MTKAAPLDAAREPLSRAAAWGLEVLRSRHLGKHAKNTGSHRAERTCRAPLLNSQLHCCPHSRALSVLQGQLSF